MRGFKFSKKYTSEDRLQKQIYFYVGIYVVNTFLDLYLSMHCCIVVFVLIYVIILTPVTIKTNHISY
jgi:hypothetical protein